MSKVADACMKALRERNPTPEQLEQSLKLLDRTDRTQRVMWNAAALLAVELVFKEKKVL